MVGKSVREIMGIIFRVDPQAIDASATRDTIESWDSLHHINLILALEEHFNIQFSLDDVEQMDSFRSIVDLILARLDNGSAR
ncbi:MAG: acyl carrier protein [Deltaproteobacteria bacterium]|nr:acyl carrier protein [Deltaproteobacteria bacterium]